MKYPNFLLAVIAVFFFGCTGPGLRIDGKKDYQIVIPVQGELMEHKAAQQLQYYLYRMSGVNLPVVMEREYSGNRGIYIGRTDYASTLEVDFDFLEEDGYAYRRQGDNLVIAGGSRKGVLYGVYDLLESLGFRKYTSSVMHIPQGNSIALPQNDTAFVPMVTHRQIEYGDSRDPGYFDWHKLTSTADNWGLFVHTFNNLVPPARFFETNPEFYALRDGERLPFQLCLSNQKVFELVVENLKERMSERPHLKYWSVSQEDNDLSCQCDSCIELDRKYGGISNQFAQSAKYKHSGSIIYFINKVAREFPDKMISTLAYWYSREAPDNIKPEPNVNIMLCNIESLRHRSVFDTDSAFSEDLRDWGAIAEDIILWDYNVQFSNLVGPFPNLHTIGPNIKFFTDNNVNMFFMQGNRQIGGEMAELRAYLISRLLWNPGADPDAIIDDFVNGYYGAAGPYIRQYIDTMRYALLDSDHQLRIFGSPEEARNTYLSVGMMDEYKKLFDEAEKAVARDAELLRRVRIARLPVMYSQIQISRTEIDTPGSMFQYDANKARLIPTLEIKEVVNRFVEIANDQGVTLLRERSITPEDYLASHNRIYERMNDLDDAISLNKKVIPVTFPSDNFKGIEALTDGVFGSYEAWRDVRFDNWVGYEGEHMTFILDLGEVRPVKSINMDFFDSKDTRWYRMYLPSHVTYSLSVDGENYHESVKVINPRDPEEPWENIRDNMVYVQSFDADMENREARFIKVHAESILTCPSWTWMAGRPAIIFTDEIVVR
jgi:hypothetical protein